MIRNPTPAQLAAALHAHDEALGMNQAPNYKQKASAMLAALRAAADLFPGGAHEQVQRGTTGR